MTTVAPSSSLAVDQARPKSLVVFGVAVCAFILASCLAAGWAPLGFSVSIVFLFAGPHNWFEARYFLAKMPPRWGKLKLFFTIGLAGVVLLTVSHIVMSQALRAWGAGGEAWFLGLATWNSLLLAWVTWLICLRMDRPPRRPNWVWALPIACLLLAVNWLLPLAWSLGLVYLHPLLALVFVDRELGRRNRAWRNVYRRCLWLLPVMLGGLWWHLAGSEDLAGDDLLALQISRHAGGGILTGVSTHLLVSTHTFLEMLHYAVWVLVIPLIGLGTAPWNLSRVPLARASRSWQAVIAGALGLGCVFVLALWAGFLVDYPLTRDIYFTVALAHVLAEFPFLLRML